MTAHFPIRYVIVEGPDLAGKSTFIQHLHRKTKFKYNIQDRSCLSMLCYARQYKRGEQLQKQFLEEELSDLNNFFIVLLPTEEILLDRLSQRGDEFQNEKSVVELRKIFSEEAEKIQHMPNVLVIRDASSADQLSEQVALQLHTYENMSPAEVGSLTSFWVNGIFSSEAQLQAKLYLTADYEDGEILNDLHEGEYYREILNKCKAVINDEINGINPYSLPQGIESRRFYYASDSCISSIHFMPRGDVLKVLCTLRSTDVKKNGSIDTRFLAHLSGIISKTFSWPVSNISLNIKFNSAHVR